MKKPAGQGNEQTRQHKRIAMGEDTGNRIGTPNLKKGGIVPDNTQYQKYGQGFRKKSK